MKRITVANYKQDPYYAPIGGYTLTLGPDLPKIRFGSGALFVSRHCLDRAVAPIYSYSEDVGS